MAGGANPVRRFHGEDHVTVMNAAAYIAKQSSVKDDSRQLPECMRLLVKALQRGQSLGAAARFRLPSIGPEPSCSCVLRSLSQWTKWSC